MQALSARIIKLAQVRRRFDYRRLHNLLRSEFPNVNHKKIYRLHREADLAVRRRKKAKWPPAERQPLSIATARNAVWSMDFVSDALATARRLKCLTVADDFSHECVEITVDHGIGGAYAVRALDQAACFRGYPRAVRTDNGPEFTSRAVIAWSQQHGIRHLLVHPASWSTRQAYAERLHRELQLDGAATGRTRFDVELEHALEALCPAHGGALLGRYSPRDLLGRLRRVPFPPAGPA
jgi:transposase InsO family protein